MKRPRPGLRPLLAVVVAAAAMSPVRATPPVVAAFERFGRAAADVSGGLDAADTFGGLDAADTFGGLDAADTFGGLDAADAGRLLIGELGCTACHASDLPDLAPKGGPTLAGVGTRVSPSWLPRFLADPTAAAAGTTMPHPLATLPDDERAEVAEAIAAYLMTQLEPTPLPRPTGTNPMPHEFWNLGDASRGDTLYHRVGCVACHAPIGARLPAPTAAAILDDDELREAGLPLPERPFASVPLEHVAAKYTRPGLTAFLMVPYHARPAGRMPDMKLLAAEAADIAAFLGGAFPERPAADTETLPRPADEAVVSRGRMQFATLRCHACHATGDQPPAPVAAALPLAGLDPRAVGSCIAAEPGSRPGVVHYPLDEPQRYAVAAAIERVRASAASPAAEVDVAMLRLNCLGCHERDGRGGVAAGRRDWFETVERLDLGDEGRLPPRLTGVGARLQKPWLVKAVAGGVELRPFMHARMPSYTKDQVGRLPDQFRAADVAPAAAGEPPQANSAAAGEPPQANTAAAGEPPQDAADSAAVFAAAAAVLDAGCIQCHPLGDRRMPGVVGVNLAQVTRRVERDWFHRLLLNPLSVRPGTKMPAFFGATIDRGILDGDADRQVAAVWAYLDRDTFEPVPPKLLAAAAADHELVPGERPIVQRTFMPRAGTHAVAVGFPAGVHLAFDGDRCRLAEAWRERFLDSRATWLIRTAPPTDPLGTDIVAIDTVPPVAILAAATTGPASWPAAVDDVRFLGYSLDAAGVPTFRHAIGGVTIAERIEPDDDGGVGGPDAAAPRGLRRRIEVESWPAGHGSGAPGIWWCPLAGADLAATATGARAGSGAAGPLARQVTASRLGGHGAEAVVRSVETDASAAAPRRAWTMPLGPPGTTLEVRYRW
jgi:mono/diheme cytochrome c family protein